MSITLYHFPGACSRVTMNALEEIGLDYKTVCVNLRSGDQNSRDYLSVNPKGKVPALAMDHTILTENAAILWTLHRLDPGNHLFPDTSDPIRNHEYLSDLVWCSGTMHPMVRQIRMPGKWTKGDPDGVRADGIEKFLVQCERFSDRIGDGWWSDDRWTIVDTYIYWGYSTAQKGGFPLDRFPVLLDHANRVRARKSFQKVLANEQAALDANSIADVVL